jgi:carbamoyltransferase
MTLGFDTTEEGFKAMIAACHPADKSARPQILYPQANALLYDILKSFEALTQRGALLNTSFNLHGYPIVNSAKEAVHVFQNSDLDVLVLNNYLITKKG